MAGTSSGELHDSARRYRESVGLVQVRAGAEWLVAAARADGDPLSGAEVRGVVAAGLVRLPAALAQVVVDLRAGVAAGDDGAQVDALTGGWDLMCLRDAAEALRTACPEVVGGDVVLALADFDRALAEAAPSFTSLRPARQQRAETVTGVPRPWWGPGTT